MASTWLPYHIVYTLTHNNLLMVDIGAPQGICCAADKQATKFTAVHLVLPRSTRKLHYTNNKFISHNIRSQLATRLPQ